MLYDHQSPVTVFDFGPLPVHHCFLEFFSSSECTSCVIGIVTKDGNNERERGTKEKHHVEFTTCNIRYLHVTSHQSGSIFPPCVSHYPVAQTELESWLRGPYFNSLTKLSGLKSSRIIWRPRNLPGTGGWLLDSGALRMGLNILVVQCTPSPLIVVDIVLNVSYATLDLESGLSLFT